MTLPAEAVSLMYHDVTDRDKWSGFQRNGARPYILSRDTFDAHLAEIQRGPLRPALIDDVDLGGVERHLFLTFDDGGRSAVHVAERLAQLGWPGHFFIVTEQIGERTFLDPSEIREIRQMGHHVGSHSHTHPDIFWDLPLGRMTAEWKQSGEILSDILGEPCISASIPGGDTSRTVLKSAANAGMRYVFTSEPRLQIHRVGDCHILGRLTVKGDLSLDALRARLAGRGWVLTMLQRQLKLLARRTLAPMYRMYVRRSTRTYSGPVQACATSTGVRDDKL